jgi:hypothetical protein
LLAKIFSGKSLFCQEASATKPIQVKSIMVATSSKTKQVDPKIIKDGLPRAAMGCGSLGGKNQQVWLAEAKNQLQL